MVLKAGGEVPEERSLCEGVPISSQLCRDVDRDDIGCEDAIPIGCDNDASNSFGSHEAVGCSRGSEQDWVERRGRRWLPRVQEIGTIG